MASPPRPLLWQVLPSASLVLEPSSPPLGGLLGPLVTHQSGPSEWRGVPEVPVHPLTVVWGEGTRPILSTKVQCLFWSLALVTPALPGSENQPQAALSCWVRKLVASLRETRGPCGGLAGDTSHRDHVVGAVDGRREAGRARETERQRREGERHRPDIYGDRATERQMDRRREHAAEPWLQGSALAALQSGTDGP